MGPLSVKQSWRKERDSNPRYGKNRILDFESSAFDHSAIFPVMFILTSNRKSASNASEQVLKSFKNLVHRHIAS